MRDPQELDLGDSIYFKAVHPDRSNEGKLVRMEGEIIEFRNFNVIVENELGQFELKYDRASSSFVEVES